MAYYDRFAKQWHDVTGFEGGPLKKHVLNDRIVERIPGVAGQSLLELGAGNGYFLPLLLRRFSGQVPGRIVVTDISEALLGLAQRHCRVEGAEYRVLDIRAPFPFPQEAFDLVLATMVFNEVSDAGLHRAVAECGRVLRKTGLLIATVPHPDFVAGLSRRGELRRGPGGVQTMPSARGLRLPIFPRTIAEYQALFSAHGLDLDQESVFPTEKVLREKAGLRKAGSVPIALVLACRTRRREGTARSAEADAMG